MSEVFAGVDVGGFTKGFHLAFVDGTLRVELARARSVDECVDRLRRSGARVVAIDAPASWAPDGELSRPCERAFARTHLCGIRFTPDAATAAAHPGNFYEWIEHGLELWSECRTAGFSVVEGFPTASWTAWLGPRGEMSRASWTKRGINALRSCGVRGLETVGNQDERDAVAAALTARQLDEVVDRMDRFGDLVAPQRGTWPLDSSPRPLEWGRLVDGSGAPTRGERTDVLVQAGGFRVEQILSGTLDRPEDYVQDHDEWVVVVDGAAVLEVDEVPRDLTRGDWCFLPAGVAHRLVRTEPGTSWIAVRSR